MRTTLDIDNDVLQAAKELARTEKKTAGKVISDLVRHALTHRAGFGEEGVTFESGWYVLPRRADQIVTKELVDRLIEEANFEDAGFLPK